MLPPNTRGAKVLPFPPRVLPRPEPKPHTLAWQYRCAGHCGALVSSPLSLCLHCAAEDR